MHNSAGTAAYITLEDILTETDNGNESGQALEHLTDQMPGGTGSVTSKVIVSAGAENRPTAATELLRTEAGDVNAGMVTMDQAGAEQVTAERLVMTNSGARSIDTRSAQVERSGVLSVRSDKAVFYNSTAMAVATDEARIVRGRVLLLKAERATIEADAKIGVFVGTADNGVRPLVDTRGAAAFGVGVGATFLLLGSILRRLLRLR